MKDELILNSIANDFGVPDEINGIKTLNDKLGLDDERSSVSDLNGNALELMQYDMKITVEVSCVFTPPI